MKTIQEILNHMNAQSEHVPTVYDCRGCKYNTGLIKGEHCHGCQVINGTEWVHRARPSNYEPFETTFTTQTA